METVELPDAKYVSSTAKKICTADPVIVDEAIPRFSMDRRMGNTELSYYLPSRKGGVNDMNAHIGFRAPLRLFTPDRVIAAWALLRLQHPPLATRVVSHGQDCTDVHFVYSPPSSVEDVFGQACATIEFRDSESGDVLFEEALNGRRLLSDERLVHLVFSTHSSSQSTNLASNGPRSTPSQDTGSTEDIREFDLLICAAHFIGDGVSLHRCANDLFTLLAGIEQSTGAERTTDAIIDMVRQGWEALWGTGSSLEKGDLPRALEDRLPTTASLFKKAVEKVDFQLSQDRLIGAHTFPKRKSPTRHTKVLSVPFAVETTNKILRKCKENDVSIANALFALIDIAWIRMKEQEEEIKRGRELPLMIYSALNLRPNLSPTAESSNNSYWFVAISYFNVVLPSFLPKPDEDTKSTARRDVSFSQIYKTFWYRAHVAKKQITIAAKHAMLSSRAREMASLRMKRACIWAKEEDEKSTGLRTSSALKPMPLESTISLDDHFTGHGRHSALYSRPPAPSAALVGLSLLGNLDGTYKHADYPSVKLYTLRTNPRQREGAILMFGYTFSGRLWLSLGYDENGLEEDTVRRWWDEVLKGVNEILAC